MTILLPTPFRLDLELWDTLYKHFKVILNTENLPSKIDPLPTVCIRIRTYEVQYFLIYVMLAHYSLATHKLETI